MNSFIRNCFKKLNFDWSEGAGSLKESVLENKSLILIILSDKKPEKGILSGSERNPECKACRNFFAWVLINFTDKISVIILFILVIN